MADDARRIPQGESHRLETEHGKVFAVISGAITWVNWYLDHLYILGHGTGIRSCASWDMAHTKVRVLQDVQSKQLNGYLLEYRDG